MMDISNASLQQRLGIQTPRAPYQLDPKSVGAASTGQGNSSAQSDLEAAVGPAYTVELSKAKNENDWNDPEVRQAKRAGVIACQTCQQRKYQDGSDDPGVSFKSPGHISPEASAAVVLSHEREHVSNEQAKAATEKRKVVAQSVRIFVDVCPECGKSYVSGGETTTTTAAAADNTSSQQSLGNQIDIKA